MPCRFDKELAVRSANCWTAVGRKQGFGYRAYISATVLSWLMAHIGWQGERVEVIEKILCGEIKNSLWGNKIWILK